MLCVFIIMARPLSLPSDNNDPQYWVVIATRDNIAMLTFIFRRT